MCRLATLAIVTLVAALWSPARADIRIGVASPMTGPQSWGGEQFERAAEMAVADLNATGGVLRQSVELIIGDDFCELRSGGGAGSQAGERRRRLRRRPSLLARIDRGRQGLRSGKDPYDFPGELDT